MHWLITGASRGIGLALAAAARARGDHVTGTCRAAPAALAIDWVQVDVTDAAGLGRMVAGLSGGNVELLVCNAGLYLDRGLALADYDAALWAETLAVNVTGVFLTVQAVLPRMASGGRIAIISSQMASTTKAPGGAYAYRASKAAVLNLGRNLASDLRGRGIAVGIYHPGWVRTEMGGSGADISEPEAASGLMARFDALSLATTGCFQTWDGRQLPF